MSAIYLIYKIKIANKLSEVIELDNYKKAYREAIRLLHPDICELYGATEALAKLNQLKASYEKEQKTTWRNRGTPHLSMDCNFHGGYTESYFGPMLFQIR